MLESKQDHNVYNIAELGIGLNLNSKFNGFILEDEECMYRSVYIGIGISIRLGRDNKSEISLWWNGPLKPLATRLFKEVIWGDIFLSD